jgi:hypothetical protein
MGYLKGKDKEEELVSSLSSSSSDGGTNSIGVTNHPISSLWLTDVQVCFFFFTGKLKKKKKRKDNNYIFIFSPPSQTLTKERLAQYFAMHGGPVNQIKIIEGKKNCAIVNFFERQHAEKALQQGGNKGNHLKNFIFLFFFIHIIYFIFR